MFHSDLTEAFRTVLARRLLTRGFSRVMSYVFFLGG